MLCKIKLCKLILFAFLFFLNSSIDTLSENYEDLELQFKAKSLAKLKYFQEQLIRTGRGIFSEEVNFILKNHENNYKGKISIDGIGREHFLSNDIFNSTFKVKLKENNKEFKYNEFRLLDPKAAYYDVPYLYNIILDHFNLPKNKIFYTKVKNNFSVKDNIKLLEESLGRNFINKNFLREGLIFKFDIYNEVGTKARLENQQNKISFEEYMNVYYSNIKSSNLNIFDEKKYDNQKGDLQKKYASKIINEYLVGIKKPFEVFDIETTIKYFFINLLWGDFHTLQAHNIRFYFNPINQKLYLIPTDPLYVVNYNNDYSDKFPLPFASIDQNKYELFKFKFFDIERQWTKNLINDNNFKFYFLNFIRNLDENNLNMLLEKISNYSIKFPNIYSSNSKKNLIDNINYVLKLIKDKNFKIENKLSYEKNKDLIDKISNNKNLIIDFDKKLIKFAKRNITLIDNIFFDDFFHDFYFIIDKGSNISMKKNSKIFFTSNIIFEGTKNEPINFSCENNCEVNFFYNKRVELNYVNFTNFSQNSQNSFRTSPLTFFNSNLQISNLNLVNFKAEDQINIIDSKFSINNSNFSNSLSDMIDIDNGEGEIKNISVENCGNDCLDFSSTNAKLENINILNSKDKGISVGENSNIKLKNIEITNCGQICLASKDSSLVEIENIKFDNSFIGIASYNKKNIFDYGNVEIFGKLEYSKISHPFIQEKKNSIIFNGISNDVFTDNLSDYIQKK